jgi:DNA-binding NtrC family response regulator
VAFGALPGFVTRDPALRERLRLLERAAATRIPVLLQGESGTGKEVAAQALHQRSLRGRGPFVAVNCGAISAELAESELFGHERGAFTGAVSSSPGAFGAADGGTLFLDEIGDLAPHLQVKLLRALESSEVRPVGAVRPRVIDVRIVSASCRDLRRLVGAGAFREDLYFRLRGLVVELTPLRERPQDVLPLAEHFLAAEPDAAGICLTADARSALLAHPWPGNARELRHAIRLGAALCEGGALRARDLRLEEPITLPSRHAPPPASPYAAPEPHEHVSLRGRTLDELEALAIRASYLRLAGARRSVCAELGIARSSLLRKLSALGLRSPRDGALDSDSSRDESLDLRSPRDESLDLPEGGPST